MAEFDQSPATRQAMQDAARAYLRSSAVVAALAGTSDKKSRAYKTAQRRLQRYTAREGQQRRAPDVQALAQVADALEVETTADYAVADDLTYQRRGKHMRAHLPSDKAGEFLADALNNPDEAWQTFLDYYAIPAGTAERATVTLR